jgi:hypothetical protein
VNNAPALLDTRTLAVVSTAVALILGVIGVWLWRTQKAYPGRWALANLLTALGLLFLSLRGSAPDWISIGLANALVIGAAILFLQGTRRFRGLRILWWPECTVGVLALAGVIVFRYSVDNINLRILAMGLALGLIGIACGIAMLKGLPGRPGIGVLITGIAFTAGGVINLWRGIDVFASPVTSLLDHSIANTLLFLAASVGTVCWSLGFIVLTSERPTAVAETTSAGPVPDDEVRQQLHRIIESDIFRRSAQMERFLTLAVERALLGRLDELKEYALARDVFHRGEDYDPRTDSIVRVEAQRLRRKLREYYESQGSQDPVTILLPSRGYVPAFGYQRRAEGRAYRAAAK